MDLALRGGGWKEVRVGLLGASLGLRVLGLCRRRKRRNVDVFQRRRPPPPGKYAWYSHIEPESAAEPQEARKGANATLRIRLRRDGLRNEAAIDKQRK